MSRMQFFPRHHLCSEVPCEKTVLCTSINIHILWVCSLDAISGQTVGQHSIELFPDSTDLVFASLWLVFAGTVSGNGCVRVVMHEQRF